MQSNFNSTNIHPNFEGTIFATAKAHKTKGVNLCKFGDQELLKAINRIFEQAPDCLSATYKQGFNKSVEVKVDNITPSLIPEMPFWKYLVYQISPTQHKLLSKFKSKVFDGFIYQINEKELNLLKKNPLLINRSAIIRFEDNVKSKLSPDDLKNSKSIFY